MRLVKYNPFDEMTLFKNAFNDFFNDRAMATGDTETFSPAVDIVDKDNEVHLNVELPGIKKEDISVNIENRVLTISGERNTETEEKKENYYRRERRYGSFKRAFSLSEDIATNDITADYVDGVLKVVLKKDAAKEEIKQITVN